jgi:hypothetical protein
MGDSKANKCNLTIIECRKVYYLPGRSTLGIILPTVPPWTNKSRVFYCICFSYSSVKDLASYIWVTAFLSMLISRSYIPCSNNWQMGTHLGREFSNLIEKFNLRSPKMSESERHQFWLAVCKFLWKTLFETKKQRKKSTLKEC